MAGIYLAGLFGLGFAVALWDPDPKVILTLAVGISSGMLLLGPYSAAAIYATRLQRFRRGRLRWPVCLLVAVSAVFILDYFLTWTTPQLVMAGVTASMGTVFGHDATVSVLELRASPVARIDPYMVFCFPLFVGLAVLAGYCSLGFGFGLFKMARVFLG
ncbi:MAG: hypothetical protein VX733_04865 [Candidatus Latescibacterota bacterium]|nr:hypothetical protein [Candidatus Latescibacterota bacterium]